MRFIAVAPDVRGNGVGALLVDAFEKTLPPGAGYHAWTLGGRQGGEEFYKACGFSRDVSIDDHIRMCRVPLAAS